MKTRILVLAIMLIGLFLGSLTTQAQDDAKLTLTVIGRYDRGIFDEGAAEISTYHPASATLFVSNGALSSLDLLDLSDPTTPILISEIDLESYGNAANSVAVHGDWVAVSIDGEGDDAAGSVLFFTVTGEFISSVQVGVVPDMIIFTPDGSKILVANEGEPNDDYTIDPEGTVSIIDISSGVETATVTTIDFTDFNADGSRAEELPADVRIFGLNASVAQDLEPEHIAVSPDGTTAYVAFQENNAMGVIDIESASVTAIVGLGFKDHSLEGNGLDASNKDDAINIQLWSILGMYQPDAIVAVEIDGATYIISANEGDSRDYGGYSEESRVSNLTLDAEVFPNAEELQADENLGRLKVTTANGDTDDDGDLDVIYSYGARSFSIWSAIGELVWDSGDAFEQIMAELVPQAFNSEGTVESFDDRSDDKGVEPESIAVGEIDGTLYAFIGLERSGGVMVYDITDLTAPVFVDYVNHSDWAGNVDENSPNDLSPEGLVFISTEDSPNGSSLLIVTNEISGTTTIYEIQ